MVGGDDDAFRADQDLASFDCGLEGVVVCPDLDVMASNLAGSEFFDKDVLLSFVAIPPYVVGLDEEAFAVCGAAVVRLACACWAIVPLGTEIGD